MLKPLKVPLACDASGSLTSAEEAIKQQQYFCPVCGTHLILRRGHIKVPHFAHKPNDSCNQETIIHKTAKLIVQQAVTDWKTGKTAAPLVRRLCQICCLPVEQKLPDKVESAVLEYRLADGFVADVGLLVADRPEAVIEIRVTHAVDEAKGASLSLPFIELDGYAVLETRNIWEPITDQFRPLICDGCKVNFRRFRNKTLQIANGNKLELPTKYYRYAPCQCWRCHTEILVFTWPGRELHESRQPISEPVPSTIRYTYSKTIHGKYWANVCPRCSALQGDWFLFAEPDGPFFGFYCGDDTAAGFHRDLMKLASLANYKGHL